MIQLDFSEILLDKHEIEKLIKNKRWLKSWSYTSLYQVDLKHHYALKMAEKITTEKLDALWCKKLNVNSNIIH